MNSTADDAEELTIDVLGHRQALMRGENADSVNVAGAHEGGFGVGVLVGVVADVAVLGGVGVDCIPEGAAAIEVVSQQDLDIGVESHVAKSSPGRPFRSPSVDALDQAGFGVERSSELGAGSAVRRALGSRRLVDGQEAQYASFEVGRRNDLAVRVVVDRDRIRVSLDERHHQTPDPRVFGEDHSIHSQ